MFLLCIIVWSLTCLLLLEACLHRVRIASLIGSAVSRIDPKYIDGRYALAGLVVLLCLWIAFWVTLFVGSALLLWRAWVWLRDCSPARSLAFPADGEGYPVGRWILAPVADYAPVQHAAAPAWGESAWVGLAQIEALAILIGEALPEDVPVADLPDPLPISGAEAEYHLSRAVAFVRLGKITVAEARHACREEGVPQHAIDEMLPLPLLGVPARLTPTEVEVVQKAANGPQTKLRCPECGYKIASDKPAAERPYCPDCLLHGQRPVNLINDAKPAKKRAKARR